MNLKDLITMGGCTAVETNRISIDSYKNVLEKAINQINRHDWKFFVLKMFVTYLIT